MKKLIILVACILFVGCIKEPISNYKGGIVVSKDFSVSDQWYIVRTKGRHSYGDRDSIWGLHKVYVYKSEWEKYSIGDTIKE